MAIQTHFEAKWKARGFEIICGIDEAGRGPWAGPLVSAAVYIPSRIRLPGLNDSKKLSPKIREVLFEIIKKSCFTGIGIVDNDEIDAYGLGTALKNSYKKALASLSGAMRSAAYSLPQAVLLDGKHAYDVGLPLQAIVRGDARVRCIAAASIIAKVTRDRMMGAYAAKYPHYGFERHKGYGTRRHRQLLDLYGPCKIHRKSFSPVNEYK